MLRSVTRTVARNLLCLALLAGSFLIVRALVIPTMHLAPTDATPGIVEEHSPTSRASILSERHDCWSGEAPANMQGAIPGHVVVTAGDQTGYAGDRMVGKALEQLFGDVDHGLTVHAFCR